MAAYSLSTLDTIVADFGDNSATVAEFGDATGAVIVTAADDDDDDDDDADADAIPLFIIIDAYKFCESADVIW